VLHIVSYTFFPNQEITKKIVILVIMVPNTGSDVRLLSIINDKGECEL